MSEPVKPRRKYASTRRATQASDTRDAVIAAARERFIAAGWQGTTIADVARSAGVSNETIYAVFGNKQALLRAVLERAIRRSEPEVPLIEQAGPQAVVAATDQRTQIRLFAHDITGVLSNVAELIAVVRTAAESDTKLAGLYRELHEGRRRNLAVVARALLARGPLKPGMNATAATAALWRLASPELFLLMTRTEGVEAAEYAEWLERALAETMLLSTERLNSPRPGAWLSSSVDPEGAEGSSG